MANTGEDQVVDAGAIVSLDGNNSEDPEGGPLKYSWIQITGTPSIMLNDKEKAAPLLLPQTYRLIPLILLN